jgi:anaerobic selenocysteine-containing dehydrogenase
MNILCNKCGNIVLKDFLIEPNDIEVAIKTKVRCPHCQTDCIVEVYRKADVIVNGATQIPKREEKETQRRSHLITP